MKHYVYKLLDTITNEFYYGSRSYNGNPYDDIYMGSYTKWNPIDKSRLEKTIIKSNFKNRESCIKYEAKLITENIDNVLNRNYHIPNTGYHTAGSTLSESHKLKIGKSSKGKIISEAQRNQISNTLKGHVVSAEIRKKISEAHIGKILSEAHKRNIGDGNRGKIVSESSREKMRKPKNSSHKKNMSIARQGVLLSDEHKSKISANSAKYWLGKSQPKIKCPHCEKIGGNTMKRWHFDNCKLKEHK